MAPGQNSSGELGDRLPDGSIPSGLMVADAVAVEPVAALGNGARPGRRRLPIPTPTGLRQPAERSRAQTEPPMPFTVFQQQRRRQRYGE